MTDVTIRPARPRDLTDIMAMIRGLTQFHGDEPTMTHAALQEILFGAAPRATAFIAAAGDVVVGYAGVTHGLALHQAEPRFDVHHLFIVDGYRSQGIGRRLIAAAGDMARAKGARGMTIGTDPANKTAQAAYRAMGFADIPPAPRFWIPVAD